MEPIRLGSYVLGRFIGAGGMGHVYAGEHELLRRPVAIKILKRELAVDPTMVQRFINEARAAAAVEHPAIVRIADVGRYEDTAYIAMELCIGRTLAQHMADQPLTRQAALSIAGQMAGALAASHAAGVVHRDLKPDNVFLLGDERGASDPPRIKLLDFGVAKLMESTDGLTSLGMVIGTPSYMSPEQCCAEPVDHRADIYALGCVVFAMLAGRPPFLGQKRDLIAAHIKTPPPRLRELVADVPPDLEGLVDQMLDKLPDNRPQSAAELVVVFKRLEEEVRDGTTEPVAPPRGDARKPVPPLPRLSARAPAVAAKPVAAASKPEAAPPKPEAAPPKPVPAPPKPVAAPRAIPAAAPSDATAPMQPIAARPSSPPPPRDEPEVTVPTRRIDVSEEAATQRVPRAKQLAALASARFGDPALEDQVTAPRPPFDLAELEEASPSIVSIVEELVPLASPPQPGAGTVTDAAVQVVALGAPSPRRPNWLRRGAIMIASAACTGLIVVALAGRDEQPGAARSQDPGTAPMAALTVDAGVVVSIDAAADEAVTPPAVDEQPPIDGSATEEPDPLDDIVIEDDGRVTLRPRRTHDAKAGPVDASVGDDTAAPVVEPAPDAGTTRAPPPPPSAAVTAELKARQEAYERDPQPGQLLKLGDVALESGNRALAIYYYRALIKVKPQSRDATTARQRLEGIRTALEQELAADKARRQPAPTPPPPP